MREVSKHGSKTFALTADVADAHRQIPIDEQDLDAKSYQDLTLTCTL